MVYIRYIDQIVLTHTRLIVAAGAWCIVSTRDVRMSRLGLTGYEVGFLVGHIYLNVCIREVLWPIVLPGVRVSRVADGIGAVAQFDAPVFVERVEVRDRTHPLAPLPNNATAAMCWSALAGKGWSKLNAAIGTANTTSVTAAPR